VLLLLLVEGAKESEYERWEGRGTQLQAEDTGQWHQASHGAWRPHGGQSLLPVGTVALIQLSDQGLPARIDSA
jgi:hypothetical protein